MIDVIRAAGRVYRCDVPAGEDPYIRRGQYSYLYRSEWHPVVNPEVCRMLDQGIDPGKVVALRVSRNHQDWLNELGNHAEWFASKESSQVPDEPLNGPAALIRLYEALAPHVEDDKKLAEALDMVVRLVTPWKINPGWCRVQKMQVDESDLASLEREEAPHAH